MLRKQKQSIIEEHNGLSQSLNPGFVMFVVAAFVAHITTLQWQFTAPLQILNYISLIYFKIKTKSNISVVKCVFLFCA